MSGRPAQGGGAGEGKTSVSQACPAPFSLLSPAPGGTATVPPAAAHLRPLRKEGRQGALLEPAAFQAPLTRSRCRGRVACWGLRTEWRHRTLVTGDTPFSAPRPRAPAKDEASIRRSLPRGSRKADGFLAARGGCLCEDTQLGTPVSQVARLPQGMQLLHCVRGLQA